jgi:hypothetical protein
MRLGGRYRKEKNPVLLPASMDESSEVQAVPVRNELSRLQDSGSSDAHPNPPTALALPEFIILVKSRDAISLRYIKSSSRVQIAVLLPAKVIAPFHIQTTGRTGRTGT